VIYLLRDPRDAISSRSHKNNKGGKTIWGTLGEWKAHQAIADSLVNVSRFITVKYEDFVSRPDEIQEMLCNRMPFLKVKAKFSDYHTIAKPSGKSNDALGGVRPIAPTSVGTWKNNLPFLKAQIDQYGDITSDLIRLGYEPDDSWHSILEEVEADNTEAPKPRHSPAKIWWHNHFTLPRRCFVYWLSCLPVIGAVLTWLRHKLRQLG
jgi:hypothetical protein